jgi:hypothetical protein
MAAAAAGHRRARVGDLLEVLAEDNASGWLSCRSGGGREGWVPINTLEAATPEPATVATFPRQILSDF